VCVIAPINPPDSVFFRLAQLVLPIWCALVFLTGGSGSVIYAQFDTRPPQNRNLREVRNTPPPSPAAVMMQEMQTARQQLPWNELTPAVHAKIRTVVAGNPLFHRMPQQKVSADPEIYQFLLRHPDLVVGFWEQMGATQLSLNEIRENLYLLKELGGTAAAVEVLYRADTLCVLYVRGEYRGPLLARAYQGDAVLVLRTQYAQDEMNEPMVICDLDAFVQINSLGADVLAKLFFSSLSKVAEGNFEVTMEFVSQVSRAAVRNPNALKEMSEEIPGLRQEVHSEFCEVVDMTALRFARRNKPAPLSVTPPGPQPVTLPADVVPNESMSRERMPEESMPGEKYQDFVRSTREPTAFQPSASSSTLKPPADWGMEHFVDSPPLFYTAVPRSSAGELSMPKPLGASFSEYVVPVLPSRGSD